MEEFMNREEYDMHRDNNGEDDVSRETVEGINCEDITMQELENGIKRLGSGTGLDGINPDVMSVIPNKLKDCILLLYNKTYGNGKSHGKSSYCFLLQRKVIH